MVAPVTSHALELSRPLPVSVERVLRAWTEPESLGLVCSVCNEPFLAEHSEGWTGCLDRLAATF